MLVKKEQNMTLQRLMTLWNGLDLTLMIERLFCFHHYVMKFERKRVYLECMNCGKETRGIKIFGKVEGVQE